MRRLLVVLWTVVVAAGVVAPYAGAAEQPLVEPVLAQARAAPADMVQVGLKAARAGVAITSATVHPRDLPQMVLPLNDSGRLGDKAGDGMWTVTFPVPDDVPPGFYYLDFEAQVTVDGQAQKATASVLVEIVKGTKRSVEIMAPTGEAVLSGVAAVAVKVVTMIPPARVSAYLGAASAEMQRDGDVWKATLDTTRATNGRHRLVVVASVAGTSADAAAQPGGLPAFLSAMNAYSDVPVVVRNPYQHYWGDLHAHTMYSDGVQAPADAYRHARDVAKLDFFAVTDHEGSTTFDEYDDVRRQADAFDQPGKFAALWGAEWTTEGGHLCYFMADRFRLPEELESVYRELGELKLTAHFNHPGLTDFAGGRFYVEGAGAMYGAEVRDLEEELSYIQLLNAGWVIGADGSQDKHDDTWGDGPNWTVALARELSRDGILEAVRARRTYSSRDRNMRLDFTLDEEDMGAVISRSAGKLPCLVTVSDPDAGERIARIEAFVDGRIVESAAPDVAAYRWVTRVDLPRGRHYVFMRVTEADGNQAWSSPIWVQAQ